jgi:hypothetical protein
MPEILTKYPESALAVLKSAGAKCGVGMKQQILTNCPSDHFCALPHGEICVYGIKDFAKMTQMSPADLADLISNVPSIYSNFNIILLMISCLFGIFIGMLLKRK